MCERVVTAGLVVIERARPWQARRLTEIAFAAKRQWGYPESWIRLWWDELVISPEYLQSTPTIVAQRDGHLVGWGAVEPADGRWWLDHLWVEPGSFGLGIGSRLLAGLVEVLVARDVHRLVIVADPNATGFYERRGATRVGEVDSQPPGRRLPVYELEL